MVVCDSSSHVIVVLDSNMCVCVRGDVEGDVMRWVSNEMQCMCCVFNFQKKKREIFSETNW